MIQVCRLVLITLAMLLAGCSAIGTESLMPQSTQADARTESKILVINSNQTLPRYKLAENGFTEALQKENIVTLDLKTEERPTELLLDFFKGQ